MDYIYRFKPRFSDFDPFGIVHHSVYYKYLEEARIEAFEHYFNGKLESFLEDQFYVLVMDLSMKFLQRIDKREYLKVCLDFNMDNGTYVLCAFSIMDDDERVVHAKGTMRLCFVDQNFRLMSSFPEKIRECIKEMNLVSGCEGRI